MLRLTAGPLAWLQNVRKRVQYHQNQEYPGPAMCVAGTRKSSGVWFVRQVLDIYLLLFPGRYNHNSEMDSSITQLIALISSTASALDVVCSQNDLHIPHLNEPLTGNGEGFRSHPEAAKLANVIASAAFELIATLLPPQEYIFQLATGVCEVSNVICTMN